MKRNMKKIYSIVLLLIFLSQHCAWAQNTEKKVSPPKKIDYNNKIYRYDPSWQNKEAYIETNLDRDTDNEIIISFMGTFKPEREKNNKDPQPFTREKKEILIIEHQAFYQIYDKGINGYYEPVKMLTGMDQPGRIEVIKLDDKNTGAIAFYSPGGLNYLDLSIYLWQDGGYRLIFNHGGAQNIYVDTVNQPVSIMNKNKDTSERNIIAVWDTTTASFK